MASESTTSASHEAVQSGPPPGEKSAGRRAVFAGLASAAGALGFYLMGADRALGYDAAVTVRNFVLTPSPFDAFRRQVVFNNHPFFSFVEHVTVDLTGSADEVTLRVAPALFAGAVVGLVVWAIARRRSLRAGIVAGAVLAANPTFVGAAREVRGYTLLVLCAVASTLLLFSARRRRGLAYTAIAAVGMATHLYMAFVLAGHAVLLWRREPLGAWRPRWMAALLAGLVANLPLLTSGAVGGRGRLFRPDFPADVAVALGGGTVASLLLLLPVLALGACADRTSVRRVGGFVAVVLVALWLAGPADLYPRFFIWLIPAVAWMVAGGIERAPRVGTLLAVASVVVSLASLPPLTEDELANRRAAAILRPLQAAGHRVCGLGWSAEAFGPYLDIQPTGRMDGCEAAAVLVPSAHPELIRQASRRFRSRTRVEALTPGIVFSDPRP